MQDLLTENDCIYVANLAIAALKNGKTSREIEKAIREIRISTKNKTSFPESEWAINAARAAVYVLYDMGGTFAQDF